MLSWLSQATVGYMPTPSFFEERTAVSKAPFRAAILVFVSLSIPVPKSTAGIVINGDGLRGGLRWDAAPFSIAGRERSLDGGLRYTVQGQSYETLRDRFTWTVVPSVDAFAAAVRQSFSAWESVDPASGLGTDIRFVEDLGTAPDTDGFGDVSFFGAEIDLFGLDGGADGLRGVASFHFLDREVTLTSGTPSYADTTTLIGVDIALNTNPNRQVWNLDLFRRVLTHEIGHAIGLADVDLDEFPDFIDDNYDGANSSTAHMTLTNSWASLVDPRDPASSRGLSVFNVARADPGFETLGVDILMEHFGAGIGSSNPVENLVPLTNDEYGMRQFLYPVAVPEPSPVLAFLMLVVLAGVRSRIPPIIFWCERTGRWPTMRAVVSDARPVCKKKTANPQAIARSCRTHVQMQ